MKRGRAPALAAQARKGSAAAPYIRSTASASGARTEAGTGTSAPCRLLAVALSTQSKR